jgi:hypothetical protein
LYAIDASSWWRAGRAWSARDGQLNKLNKGFLDIVDNHSKQPVEKDKDYQWLLKEASWQEFWLFLDQLVDWNKKREELENLNSDQSDILRNL